MSSDDYQLLPQNPLATADQLAAEAMALRLISHSEMQKAREAAAHLFRWVMTADLGDEIVEFDAFLDEYMFHHALRAANSDPCHPKVVRFMAPPHHWFGRDIPGSRWAGDSPDFIYRMIAVAHGPRYEILGRPSSAPAPTAAYSLMEDRPSAPTILSLLESQDMEFGPTGDFTITVDPTPARGRRNHIQTQPARRLADLDTRRTRRLCEPGRQFPPHSSARPARASSSPRTRCSRPNPQRRSAVWPPK